MAIEDPGQFDVTCDKCGHVTQFASTQYAGDPETFGVDDSTLEDADWGRVDGETLCESCKPAEED